MKQPIHRLAAVVALLALAGVARLSAATITLNDTDLLGTVSPGTPNNEANGTAQVLFLVNAYNGGGLDGANLGDNGADSGGEIYTLYRPDGAPALLAAPVISGANVPGFGPGGGSVVNLGGFSYQYVLFSQHNDSWIYYIGDIAGSNSIEWGGNPLTNPDAGNENGTQISHYVLFNKSDVGINLLSVPDGGTTVLLFGLGLLVTAVSARRKKTA